MKFKVLSGLLLATGTVLANGTICTEQLEKYNSCMAAVDPNILNSHSLFNISEACEVLKGNDCVDFVKDAYIPSTDCSLEDENEKDSALSIINLKITYLKYCVTDANGMICPLSEHLIETMSTNSTISKIPTQTDNEKEEKKEEKKEEDDGTFIVGEYNYLKSHAQEREFKDWNGGWKSYYPMIIAGKFDDVFASVGEQGEMFKQMYTEGFKTNIIHLDFDEKTNTVTYKYDDGKEVKAEYKYRGYDILQWQENVYGVFYKLERVDKDSEAPKYLLICDEYLKTVDHNNNMFAWISDKSFDDAYDTQHWLGFSRDELTDEEIAKALMEEMAEEAGDNGEDDDVEKSEQEEKEKEIPIEEDEDSTEDEEEEKSKQTEKNEDSEEEEKNKQTEKNEDSEEKGKNKSTEKKDEPDEESEESEDDTLFNENYYDMSSEEKEAYYYDELVNDCNIEQCNERFLALIDLMQLVEPNSEETKALASAAKYYKTKDCEGLHGLVRQYHTSGALSFTRSISFTFVLMIIFSIALLI